VIKLAPVDDLVGIHAMRAGDDRDRWRSGLHRLLHDLPTLQLRAHPTFATRFWIGWKPAVLNNPCSTVPSRLIKNDLSYSVFKTALTGRLRSSRGSPVALVHVTSSGANPTNHLRMNALNGIPGPEKVDHLQFGQVICL
jgi:hypothetical protein